MILMRRTVALKPLVRLCCVDLWSHLRWFRNLFAEGLYSYG